MNAIHSVLLLWAIASLLAACCAFRMGERQGERIRELEKRGEEADKTTVVTIPANSLVVRIETIAPGGEEGKDYKPLYPYSQEENDE